MGVGATLQDAKREVARQIEGANVLVGQTRKMNGVWVLRSVLYPSDYPFDALGGSGGRNVARMAKILYGQSGFLVWFQSEK